MGAFVFYCLHPLLSLTLFFSVTLFPSFWGIGVFLLFIVLMLSVELMLLSPETGHCGAVKEERGAGDLVLLLDV